jgi:hypothetical protein
MRMLWACTAPHEFIVSPVDARNSPLWRRWAYTFERMRACVRACLAKARQRRHP